MTSGWRCEAVGRVSDVLARLEEPGIDLVCLDLGLLDDSGLAGLERIVQAHPETPMVVLTSSDEKLAVEALQHGAQEYLVKRDLTPALLAQVLRHAMYRKRTERALRESDARFRATIQASPDAVILVVAVRDHAGELTDLRVAEINPPAEDLLGRTRASVVGSGLGELGHVLRVPDLGLACARIVETGVSFELERPVAEPDGSCTWLRYEGVRLADGLALSIRDVGDRTPTERQGESLEDELLHARKLEDIGRLAVGVAHDFNNLLLVIHGYAELLLRKLPPPDPLGRYVTEITEAAERAAMLTHQLLAFSRRQALAPRVLDPGELVGNMIRLLERLVGENIQLVPPSRKTAVGRVRADPAQLEQVLLNLAVNARDAMPSGGVLTIDLADAELDEPYLREHPSARPGAYVVLSVSDTGYGVERGTPRRILEPFFTTKLVGRGASLGLPSVYGIVKQSGGFLWVYSEPGRGSTFKVYLPRTA